MSNLEKKNPTDSKSVGPCLDGIVLGCAFIGAVVLSLTVLVLLVLLVVRGR